MNKGREENRVFRTETAEIPKGYRDMVYDRDGDCCRFENCNERGHLDIHHRIPKSIGTSHDLCNLVHLCRKHHETMQSRIPKKVNHLVAVPFEIHMYDFSGISCKSHNKSLIDGKYEKEK